MRAYYEQVKQELSQIDPKKTELLNAIDMMSELISDTKIEINAMGHLVMDAEYKDQVAAALRQKGYEVKELSAGGIEVQDGNVSYIVREEKTGWFSRMTIVSL